MVQDSMCKVSPDVEYGTMFLFVETIDDVDFTGCAIMDDSLEEIKLHPTFLGCQRLFKQVIWVGLWCDWNCTQDCSDVIVFLQVSDAFQLLEADGYR